MATLYYDVDMEYDVEQLDAQITVPLDVSEIGLQLQQLMDANEEVDCVVVTLHAPLLTLFGVPVIFGLED